MSSTAYARSLIGQRFGSWTVVGIGRRRKGRLRLVVRCRCGRKFTRFWVTLRGGTSTQCVRCAGHAPATIRRGARFGPFRVIREVLRHDRPGQGRWFRVRCDCGRRSLKRIDYLRHEAPATGGCVHCTDRGGIKAEPGQRFGSWEIVEDLGTHDGVRWVRALCHGCGYEWEQRFGNIAHGHSAQCSECKAKAQGLAMRKAGPWICQWCERDYSAEARKRQEHRVGHGCADECSTCNRRAARNGRCGKGGCRFPVYKTESKNEHACAGASS